MSVAIVTDTCHYLPRELVASEGIHEVSLYVHWPEGAQRESEITDYDAYYQRLGVRSRAARPPRSRRSATSWPSTSRCSTPGTRSSRSTWPAACRAPCARPSRPASSSASAPSAVHVVDSATACGGEGLVVLAAAAAARGGRRRRRGRRARPRGARAAEDVVRHRHARVPAPRRPDRRARRRGSGSALKIKPILTVESEITPVERVRTSRRAFERMVDLLRSRSEDGADAWMVQHIQAPREAEELAARGHRDLRRASRG